jgi:hypothetical protein
MAVEIVSLRDMYVIPVAMGIAQYLKVIIGVNTKLVPLIVVLLCALGDVGIAAAMKQPVNVLTFLGGIIAGFTAVGLFSGARATFVNKNGGVVPPVTGG